MSAAESTIGVMTSIQIQQGPSGYGWVVVDARKSSGGSVQAAPQNASSSAKPSK